MLVVTCKQLVTMFFPSETYMYSRTIHSKKKCWLTFFHQLHYVPLVLGTTGKASPAIKPDMTCLWDSLRCCKRSFLHLEEPGRPALLWQRLAVPDSGARQEGQREDLRLVCSCMAHGHCKHHLVHQNVGVLWSYIPPSL